MSNSLDLKNIEKKAFRATYQDGLWDIYMGGEVLCMSFLAYSTASEAKPSCALVFSWLAWPCFTLSSGVAKNISPHPAWVR